VLIATWRQFLPLFGNGTILAFSATSVVAIVAGHLLGGPVPGNRAALALGAAIRHPGIAMAIGHASGVTPPALIAVVLFLLNGVVVTSLYTAWLKRRPHSDVAAP
jgi:bile acid:Na+ symporter, BASS family